MAILEICANSFQSALNAERGGAHRIELCQDLEHGGVTPSVGLIKQVKQKLRLPVFVLVRPRAGDFVYDDDEYGIMLEDVRTCKALLCDGVVTGALMRGSSGSYNVDVSRMKELVQLAQPMPVVFHRAFDDCADQFQALEDVINTGCVRILTSGGADSAMDGITALTRLSQKAGDRITIMPGHGITADNVQQLRETTGASEFHSSAKTVVANTCTSRFGVSLIQTDIEQVKALVQMLQ